MGAMQWRIGDADQNGSLSVEEFTRSYLMSLGAI
jgi:hypothetical protein